MPKIGMVHNTKLVQAVKKHICLYDHNSREYNKRDVVNLAWESVANEVGDTVAHCKDTWRNLRTVFARHLKKFAAGKVKGKYYLMDEMSFLINYLQTKYNIKFDNENSICLSSPCNTLDDLTEEHYPKDYNNDSDHLSKEIIEHFKGEPEEQNEENTCNWNFQVDDNNDKNGHHQETSSTANNENNINNNNSSIIKQNESYDLHKIIKSRNNIVQQENNAKKLFLLSLLPDLEKMNDQQMRRFRTNVSNLIEEIFDDNNRRTCLTISSKTCNKNVEKKTVTDNE